MIHTASQSQIARFASRLDFTAESVFIKKGAQGRARGRLDRFKIFARCFASRHYLSSRNVRPERSCSCQKMPSYETRAMLEGIGESLQPACYRASASRQFGMFSPIRLYPQLETQEASQV